MVLVVDLAELVGRGSDEDTVNVPEDEQELALAYPLLNTPSVAEHASEPPIYSYADQYTWSQANESSLVSRYFSYMVCTLTRKAAPGSSGLNRCHS